MGRACSTPEREENSYKLPSENLGVDGRIILEWTLVNYRGKVWNIFIWLSTGTSGGGLL
jgi:hypothetical protein